MVVAQRIRGFGFESQLRQELVQWGIFSEVLTFSYILCYLIGLLVVHWYQH